MDCIRLGVVGQMHNVLYFTFNQNTPMLNLKKSYSEACGLPVTRLRFLFMSKRIYDNDTPRSLGMEHNNVVEVYRVE